MTRDVKAGLASDWSSCDVKPDLVSCFQPDGCDVKQDEYLASILSAVM
jgi:hypothetical protein